MNLVSKNKINPLVGAAGVSAVPAAARVVQVVGQQYDKSNFLVMHAMAPNVAGVVVPLWQPVCSWVSSALDLR